MIFDNKILGAYWLRLIFGVCIACSSWSVAT